MKDKTIAIVLSGGKGKRMGASVNKQYLLLEGKPILYYSLKAFDESDVDEIVVVSGKNDIDYVQHEIVDKYSIKKVTKIVAGGKERYNSVYNALISLADADYVLIHDGARPFIQKTVINECVNEVKLCKACVVGMPVKDTIKILDDEGFVLSTPKRSNVWQVQTPQCFAYSIVKNAYDRAINSGRDDITDDSMVVETEGTHKIKLIMGGYSNIKITTPEDLIIGKELLGK